MIIQTEFQTLGINRGKMLKRWKKIVGYRKESLELRYTGKKWNAGGPIKKYTDKKCISMRTDVAVGYNP
jgi:hypothetical protein